MTIKELYQQAYSILRFLESQRWLSDENKLTETVVQIRALPVNVLCSAIDSFEDRYACDPLCSGLFHIQRLTAAPPGYHYDKHLQDYIPENHPFNYIPF